MYLAEKSIHYFVYLSEELILKAIVMSNTYYSAKW